MKEIGSFFDKFKGVALKELQKRELIILLIKKSTKQEIKLEDIKIKNGIIYIMGGQGLKSEIFMKKKQIIESLKSKNFIFADIK